MVVLLIVLVAVAVLAVALAFGGGFGGFGGTGAGTGLDGPVMRRRVIHRRPARRVYTERHVVEDSAPVDGPVYRP
jgi:hypothetical protein